jgi:putative addiction module killer protein
VVDVKQTAAYRHWFRRLRDIEARARINARVRRIALHGQLFGDWKRVGGKVVELRLHLGPGYRVYVGFKGNDLLVLLAGGDKSTQPDDIGRAVRLAEELEVDDVGTIV